MVFLGFNLHLRCDSEKCDARVVGNALLLDTGTIGIAETDDMKGWQIAVDPRAPMQPYKCYCKEHNRKVDTAAVKVLRRSMETPIIQSKVH